MGSAVGTVLFFENFHNCLVFDGRTCVNGVSVQGRFHCHGRTSQWPSPLPRVNTDRHRRSFLWRSCVEHQATHSANRHCGMSRIAAPMLNQAACPRQSANRSGNSTACTPSPSWLSVRRAASAPLSSWHVHVWLHWPKLSAARNTLKG